MEAKRIFYQKLKDFIYHIPGENPSPATLCGINCFILGTGQSRVMIEAGDYPERNEKFLENFTRFMNDFSSISIDKIFITHAHWDHFGGLYDVLRIINNSGRKEPQVFKKLMGSRSEQSVFERYPILKEKVLDLNHDDKFQFGDSEGDFTLRTLFTPGHAEDHCSFLLKSPSFEEQYLFSGDIILGSPSTIVQEMSTYMDTLYKLRKEDFSHIVVPHSMDLNPDSIIFDGKSKLEAYITYREDRDKAIVNCLREHPGINKDELYEYIYGSRGLTGLLKNAAESNL